MEKTCEKYERILVDYADGHLSPDETSEVTEHLTNCEQCRTLLDGLYKSLDLATIILSDNLMDTEKAHYPAIKKTQKTHWLRYTVVAASILIVTTLSVVWLAFTKSKEVEPTVAEIEREITESASAARLLAATELLSQHPEAENIVEQQYRNIVDTYPGTAAAARAKSKIQ